MNSELEALELNHTWSVTTLPPEKTAIGSKWLYKTKFNPDGSIQRHKARLVILNCMQIYGLDYSQTFAPVTKMIAPQGYTHMGCRISQLDSLE